MVCFAPEPDQHRLTLREPTAFEAVWLARGNEVF